MVRGREEEAPCTERGDGKITDFFLCDEIRDSGVLVWGLQRIEMTVLQLRSRVLHEPIMNIQ